MEQVHTHVRLHREAFPPQLLAERAKCRDGINAGFVPCERAQRTNFRYVLVPLTGAENQRL